MGSKANFVRICAVILSIVAVPLAIQAQTLSKGTDYIQIVPTKPGNHIPVRASGSPIVGVVKLQLTAVGSTAYIGRITVSRVAGDLLGTGFVATSAPYNVHAYLNTGLKYTADNPASNAPDLTISAVSKTATDVVITIDSGDANAAVPVGADSRSLWIAFEYPAGTTANTVGYYINTVDYGPTGNRTQFSLNPPGDPTGTAPISNYFASMSATGIVSGATKDQGTTDVPVLRLDFAGGGSDENVMKQLATVKLKYLGTRAADVPAGGVTLYEDTNGNSAYDPGTDLAVSSASVSAGLTVTFPPAATLPAIPEVQFTNAVKRYFVLVNVATTAVVGNTIGFQVETPSTDITFADVEGDTGANIAGNYPQTGYVTTAGPIPSSGSYSFTITPLYIPTPPTVTSIVPGDGATGILLNANIMATFSEAVTGVNETSFLVYKGATQVLGTVTNTVGNTYQFDPNTDLDWTSTYTVTITTTVTDLNDSLPMAANKVWNFSTVVAVYPIVSATSPVNGSFDVARTTNVQATFSKNMNPATIDSSSFRLFEDTNSNQLYDPGIDTPVTPVTVTKPDALNAVLDPTPTLDWNKTYLAVLSNTILDTDALALAQTVFRFTTVIANNPRVVNTDPASSETDVLLDALVTATFSKEMNKTSVELAGTFTLKQGATTVLGSVVYDDTGSKTATFTPSAPFDPGLPYTATITTAAIDTEGLPLDSTKTWSFSTAPRPQVIITSPLNGATGVLLTTPLTATFSKAMDASTINGTTFTVLKGALPVSGTVSYTPATWTATFTPMSGTLDWDSTYTLTIDGSVKSPDQITMNVDKVWTFDTVRSTNPLVSSTIPLAFASGVVPDTNITILFSKSINTSTIVNGSTFTLKKDGTGPALGGTFSFPDATTAVFNPTADLDPGARYVATVVSGPSGVKDTDGFPLLSDKTWEFTTTPRPSVILKSPANGSVGVSRATTIKAVFSKDLNDATINDLDTTDAGSNFIVYYDANSNAIYDTGVDTILAGEVSFSHTTLTATFTLMPPGAQLLFLPYRVTVKAGPTGVKDTNGIEMEGDETWSFTTIPDLEEPVVANNRIMPGSTAPVTIFIPQPPAGASDPVTVEVFTATGRKVATLVSAKPYNQLLASLPLLWDGTNGQAQRLGPGLYFIQIRATGYVRTLKVMIVR